MITEEQWNRLFKYGAPTLSAGMGALSLTLAVMAFMRSSPFGQRVYSQDGSYLVNVRYGQWHDIREFIQPDSPDVLAVYSQIGPDTWQLLDFVCRCVSYKSEIREMWQFPSETLAREKGDCEDSTFLFVSLAQNSSPDIWAILGDYQGLGHAWAGRNGLIYETTYTSARQVADPQNYRALVAFNHHDIREAYPGALEEVFGLARNEELKLNKMLEAVGGLA